MTDNVHDKARELIVLGESLSPAQQDWLRSHLQGCEPCRQYAEATSEVVGALHSVSIVADSRLVRATQMRVRFHAARMRETQERLWIVGMACLAVGLSAALTAPLLWRLSAWMGAWAGVSSPIWQTGFILFFFAPTLVVGVLLLARDTHSMNNGEQSQQ